MRKIPLTDGSYAWQFTNRETGTSMWVSLNDCDLSYEADPKGVKWQAICEEHAFVIACRTKAHALTLARGPASEGWCEGCKEKNN